ncbi:hypothetical protein CIG19_15920 [Enterobacterales bacterium CwR94]|nr:hypothetical protein CIG19_15920 [Enterobacterales bacterium CwR94]
MATSTNTAARAIADYFNSPAFHAPQTTDLLAAIMQELMQHGQPATNKAIIASVLSRLEGEMDQSMLQGYRNLLAEIMGKTSEEQD